MRRNLSCISSTRSTRILGAVRGRVEAKSAAFIHGIRAGLQSPHHRRANARQTPGRARQQLEGDGFKQQTIGIDARREMHNDTAAVLRCDKHKVRCTATSHSPHRALALLPCRCPRPSPANARHRHQCTAPKYALAY